MSPYTHILVLCQGNICRSPVAEAMLKRALPGKHIQSAGLTAMVGQGAEPTAIEIASADGLDLSAHVARQVSSEMIQRADLILVMSEGQRNQVSQLTPHAMGKTLLLGHWLERSEQRSWQESRQERRQEPGQEPKQDPRQEPRQERRQASRQDPQKDIPDPYRKSRDVFDYVHKLMAQSIALWVNKI